MPSPDRERHDQYLVNYLTTGKRKIIGIGRVTSGAAPRRQHLSDGALGRGSVAR